MRLPPGLNELEREVIALLLVGEDEERPILREQYATIDLIGRTWKDSGYWAKFYVDETLPTTSVYDDYDLEGLSAFVSGELCNFTLSMFDGKLFLLHCETHNKTRWPNPAVLEKVFRS